MTRVAKGRHRADDIPLSHVTSLLSSAEWSWQEIGRKSK